MSDNILLPFKPFTLSEVADITRIPRATLDQFVKAGQLPDCVGDDGFTRGLDFSTTFAVFCVSKWLDEGCGDERAQLLLEFLVANGYDKVMMAVKQGLDFPLIKPPPGMPQCFMPAPLKTRLGRELNFRKLEAAFRAELDRVFPKRVVVPTN